MGLFHRVTKAVSDAPISKTLTAGNSKPIHTYREELGTSGAYAGPQGMLLGKPKDQSYAQWIGNSATGNIQGLFGNPLGKHIAAKNARMEAAHARADEAARQEGVENEVATVNRNYDPAATGGMFDSATQSWRTNQLNNLQGVFGNAIRQQRYQAGDSGTLGSSDERAQYTRNLQSLLSGRSAINQQAGVVRSSLDDSANSARMNLVNQLRTGVAVDPNAMSGLRGQELQLNSALANIPSEQLGGLFSNAGQIYTANNRATASGYQGFQPGAGLWTSRGSNTSAGRVS